MKRVVTLLLPLIIAVQAGFVAAVLPAASVVPTAAAATACTITSGAVGGMVNACADADTYAELVDDLQGSFESLRGESVTQPLSVTSTPSGANVQVNGVTVGLTPLNTSVPAGSYLVRVSKSGYESYNTSVLVGDGGATVNAPLNPVDDQLASSFNWVHPSALIGLTTGASDCQFDIGGFVKDKAGDYYVSFSCFTRGDVTVPSPVDAPGYTNPTVRFRPTLNTTGVAKTSNFGQTWTLVNSWTDTFSADARTSGKFIDGAPGTVANDGTSHLPDNFGEHWMRAYYQSTHVESYAIWGLIPREQGGVSILLLHRTVDNDQAVAAIYDNAGTSTNPQKFMGNLIQFQPAGSVYQSLSHPDAQARWGVTSTDLGTKNSVVTEENHLIGSTGEDVPITITGPQVLNTRPSYQGSFEHTDYFLGVGPGSDHNGYVFKSTDGGQTITLFKSYHVNDSTDFTRSEQLRIGPDGSLYLVDNRNGGVYALEDGGPRLLGTTPASLNFGVSGGNNNPFLSIDFDSAGNLHGAFRSSVTPSDNSFINVYYQYFPLHPVTYTGVAVLTEPNCTRCNALRAWLEEAGVSYQADPTDLPPDVAATAAVQAAQHGYPVLIRLGTDPVARGGADPAAAAQVLGVSWPAKVNTYVPRVSNAATNPSVGPWGITVMQQWLKVIVENDRPHIIFEPREGVVDLQPGDAGDWTSTTLGASPPPLQDVPPPNFVIFAKHMPAFPGGSVSLGRINDPQARFNDIAKPSDLVMLYHSEAFKVTNDGTQNGYTFWRLQAGGASDSAFREVQTVSQLIPAATFYVALGENGTAGAVAGELADYISSPPTILGSGTQRLLKVSVDLRHADEHAIAGNILSRGVGGSVHVEIPLDGGGTDARDVSLVLLVENTRLRTFDPATRAASRDITVEAVHFTGAGDHWVVANNTGLTNDIPCGAGMLHVPPFSTASFPAASVAATANGTCLDGLAVTPTVISDCHTWGDVKLVLAGDTIAALNGSLPLSRSEGATNWELSYGSLSADISRVVSFDRPIDDLAPSGSCPASAGEIADTAAAVVKISGQFIGAGNYEPSVTITDRGNAAVLTAAKARPGSLSWEREWLEFESAMLEANLSISIRDEAAANVLFLGRAAKRVAYQRQLLATRALLHCNNQGVGFDAVRQLIDRSAGVPQALIDTRVCLQDFVLHPSSYWPDYSPNWWAGGSYQADFVGSVIKASIDENPTLAYLAASSDGTVLDYGEFLIPRAHEFASHGNDVATDFELDVYARMATAASREMVGIDGRLLRVVLASGQLERSAMNALIDCAQSPGAPTLARMLELTNQKAYQPGIPCVDSRAGASRDQWFQLLGIALRSGTWQALLDVSGHDLDTAFALLDKLDAAYTSAAAIEARYPAGTTVAAWRADLPAADKLEIAMRQGRVTQDARGHQITVGELPQVLAGVTECGVGFVKGLFPDGILIILASGAAVMAGPVAAAVGGALFLIFGATVTGLGAFDLAQVWDSLDLASKTAGICGTAIGAVMTAAGIRPTVAAARSLTLADFKYSPPKMLQPETIPTTGRAGGETLKEQTESLTPQGGEIADPPQVATAPIDATIQAAVDALPAAEQATANHAVRALNVDAMTAPEKAVITALLESTDRAGRRTLRLFTLENQGKRATPEYQAWDTVGAALLEELGKPLPKSIKAQPAAEVPATATAPARPARIAGTDADIVKAVDDSGVPIEGILSNHDATAVAARQGQLLAAVLGSERMLLALEDLNFRRLFTAEEANALFDRAKAARSATTSAFFKELAGSRFVTAVKSAVEQAQQHAGMAGVEIVAIKSKLLSPGSNKVVVRLTVTLADGRTFDVAFAKGDITTTEANLYAELGPKEITQNLLSPLLENVDGTQSLLVTEFLPGLEVPPGEAGLIQLIIATSDADYASAIGALDARIWLRTRNPSGEAILNSDLHMGNIHVFDRGGVKTARAVDFDPKYDTATPEDAYWVASLMRRNSDGAMGVLNQDGYLSGVLDALSHEPGSSPTAALDLLRRTRANLDNPTIIARVRTIVGPLDDVVVADAKRALDAFLTGR